MIDTTIKRKRPLSPHLQVYKPQMTSVLSILHRMCGLALAVGTGMIVWLLFAAADGEEAYDHFMEFCTSPLGKLMIFGWSLAFYYHLSNGIRHLIWDTGRLFKMQNATLAGAFVLFLTAALTAYTWWSISQ